MISSGSGAAAEHVANPKAVAEHAGEPGKETLEPVSSNATLVYALGQCRKRVMVMPPEYKHSSVIADLKEDDLFIGKDGSVFSSGDMVYDVQAKKVLRLDTCIGDGELRFHAGGTCIAPCFLSIIDDPAYYEYPDDDECYGYAYDMILLKRLGNHGQQIGVGPVAQRLGQLLISFRGNKRRRLEL